MNLWSNLPLSEPKKEFTPNLKVMNFSKGPSALSDPARALRRLHSCLPDRTSERAKDGGGGEGGEAT